MSLRVAYNRATTPLIASDEGHVIAAGSFGVVSSTDQAVKDLLAADDPQLRLLTPSELTEPTGKQPPHRPDLVEALAELEARQAAQDEADAEAAAAAKAAEAKAAAKNAPPAKPAASTATTSGA